MRNFPTIKDFRDTYLAAARHKRLSTPALPESRTTIPEWVHVWKFARNNGDTRDFPPQYGHVEETNIMSQTEYETLKAEWVAAGSPRVLNPVLEPDMVAA